MAVSVPFHIGSIEVICGPMFSGKTEELIRRVKRAQIAKQRCRFLNPKLIIATMPLILLATPPWQHQRLR